MVYLNQAGTSWPKPEPVAAAVARALAAPPEVWEAEASRDHGEVCRALGVAEPERLLLTPGCTSALSVAISDHAWEPGDRIVVSGLEHHALSRPVELLGARGVERVVIPPAGLEPFDLARLESELGRGRVRLVAVTAACNVTGDRLPVEAIVALAHAHGSLCLVDAAQVAGWEPLDCARLGADLLAFAGHKAPQGPRGIGGLYVAPGVTLNSPAAACELPDPRGARPCAPMPGYCDVGSLDRVALAGLAAGLRWLEDPAREQRLSHARARIARVAEVLRELPGYRLHGAPSAAARMPILAVSHASRPPDRLAAELAARGVVASAGLQCAPLAHETLDTAPEGVLRLSVGVGTGESDVERACEALLTIG